MKCFACNVTERLTVSTCCGRPCCPSHRYGDGAITSGFTCSDHPFGMRYESFKERVRYVASRGGVSRWNRLKAWLRGKAHG